MVKRSGRRWLSTSRIALTLAALGLCFVVTALGQGQGQGQGKAQEPILWARNVAGDARAIQINSDDAVMWVDKGKRIFVVKGKVWVEQGDASLRATQAVIWIDEAAQKQSGIYHVDVYSDGGVSLELKARTYEAPLAMIELNTRGEVNVKTFKTKVAQKATPEDPLFQRAVAAIAARGAQPKPKEPTGMLKNPIEQAVVQTAASSPAPLSTAQPLDPGLLPSVLPASQQQGLPPGQTTQGLPPASPGLPGQLQPAPVVVAPPGQPGAAEKGPLPALLPVEVPLTQFNMRPRTSEKFNFREFKLANGEKAIVFSPGVIISITAPLAASTTPSKGSNEKLPPPANIPNNNGRPIGSPGTLPGKGVPFIPPTAKTIEIAADRVVVWTHGDVNELLGGGQPAPNNPAPRNFEFYLSGNVEIRDEVIKKVGLGPPVREARLLRGSEAYYFFTSPSPEEPNGQNVAILLDADLEERQPSLPDPIHVTTPEMHQLTDKLFNASCAQINASKLPYGPGLYVTTGPANLELKHIEKKTIFGGAYFNRDTAEQEYEDQLLFRATNCFVWLEGVPVFWLPYLQGDARDPLGPLTSLSAGYSKVFGFQLFTTWNVYDLIGMDPLPNSHWRVDFDYLSERGFMTSTDFSIYGKNLAGISGNYNAVFRAMGIDDHGNDILGGNRGEFVTYGYPPPTTTLPITHPELRGRIFGLLNWQELPYSLTVQTQLAALSDRNILDQYYNPEWINGPNQETFVYVKQQENDWAWSVLVEPRIRNWITETEWLPKLDGHWIGQDFLDTFTYSTKASAAYAHLETTHQEPLAFEPTDVSDGTGRVDWWNELSLPFQLGAFRLVPYGVVDATYYTDDLNDNGDFRFYGGGGIRGSIPFSRLFPDVQSELLNVDGIYHKIVLGGNYYWVHSDRSHLDFPQLDRLNDDESDQTLRDIRPQQPTLNPVNATMLNSGFFDPQLFALRKLVDSYVDTLDSIEVIQLDLNQRLQTKRGYPGQEHIIDWMTLDLSASFFPQSNRDNFGELVNFLQYDWSWNVGDRVSFFSDGWFDPHPGAAKVWSFGTQLNRPDTSSLYLGYRQIDPLDSKQVIASISLPFSAKYSIGASTSYDFGTNTQINSLTVTRKGTDLMVSLGFSYNTVLNSFGFTFEVLPNLLPATKQVPGFGSSMLGAH